MPEQPPSPLAGKRGVVARPQPLAGKCIVITRPLAQCQELFDALRARDASPTIFPLIRIVPVKDYAALDAALAQLRAGDWILLTSQNAVVPVATRGRLLRHDFFDLNQGVNVAAVGRASENAARAADLKVNYVADVHDGVSLARELGERLRERKVLLPRSDLASSALPTAIHEFGGEVIEVVAYRTERVRERESQLVQFALGGVAEAIICFSPSAVRALMDLLSTPGAPNDHLKKVVFAAVGETTAQAFRELGIRHPLVPDEVSSEAVVNVLAEHFANRADGQFAGAKKS